MSRAQERPDPYEPVDHVVDVEYTFGFTYNPRARCACGWVGPVRSLSLVARHDAKKHWKANNTWEGPL